MNEYLNFPGKELNVPIILGNNFFKKKQRNQSHRIINLFPYYYEFLKFPKTPVNFFRFFGNFKMHNRMEINL